MLLSAALIAAALTLPSSATAAGRRTPTLAPSDTVVDGPSSAIVGLSGLAVARDGTGGLAYSKDLGGIAHVFVSVLSNGTFQAPVQVDTGLAGPSSQPVIAGTYGGLLVVGFINHGTLYAVQDPGTNTPWQAPVALFGGAVNPSISMSTFGKAYLAFTSIGAGGGQIRTAYFFQGSWGVEPTSLNAKAADVAGLGNDAPQVATAGDGTAIVVWGEAGHIYTRRVLGTMPSIVYEQADPPSFDGWSEVTADEPDVSAGGDSSYAAVVFDELLSSGGQQQSRVLVTRLQASIYDGAQSADGLNAGGPEGAEQPRVAVQEYGAGFVTDEGTMSHNVFAAALANNDAPGSTAQLNSAFEQTAPDAVPATAGTVSTLVAWQQNPGANGPEIRVRYAANGSALGPEEVVSTPSLGPTDADLGLYAGGDVAGDAAIAFVQGTGSQTQIVTAQLYQTPGSFAPLSRFQYSTNVNPTLSWSPSSELWGSPEYIVKVDGVQVAETTATSVRVPTALAQGRHAWQVTALNQAGLSSVARPSTVFVDSIAPSVMLKITGARHVGVVLHAYVKYTDVPPGVVRSAASGVETVQIKWGDGSNFFITHRSSHAYKHRRTYTVMVIVIDRAGNRTVLKRKLKITPAGRVGHAVIRRRSGR